MDADVGHFSRCCHCHASRHRCCECGGAACVGLPVWARNRTSGDVVHPPLRTSPHITPLFAPALCCSLSSARCSRMHCVAANVVSDPSSGALLAPCGVANSLAQVWSWQVCPAHLAVASRCRTLFPSVHRRSPAATPSLRSPPTHCINQRRLAAARETILNTRMAAPSHLPKAAACKAHHLAAATVAVAAITHHVPGVMAHTTTAECVHNARRLGHAPQEVEQAVVAATVEVTAVEGRRLIQSSATVGHDGKVVACPCGGDALPFMCVCSLSLYVLPDAVGC